MTLSTTEHIVYCSLHEEHIYLLALYWRSSGTLSVCKIKKFNAMDADIGFGEGG